MQILTKLFKQITCDYCVRLNFSRYIASLLLVGGAMTSLGAGNWQYDFCILEVEFDFIWFVGSCLVLVKASLVSK